MECEKTVNPLERAKRSVRSVTERELAIELVLELAQESPHTFSPMGFYDDDASFLGALSERLDVPDNNQFKCKVIKVCRRLVNYGVLSARITQTAKEYVDEPRRQQNYTLRPGKAHLLTSPKRPGVTYGPQGEAEWLLRHAYPEQCGV